MKNKYRVIGWTLVIIYFFLIINLDIFQDFKGWDSNNFLLLSLLGGVFLPLLYVGIVVTKSAKAVKKTKESAVKWNDSNFTKTVEDELNSWVFGGSIIGYFLGIILGIILTIMNFDIS